eukprot:TRINITY_DN21698_c0_g1_i2.p1 TRINITY_DN21698_c0_g1~~TRINITY_DN21698_c0_g1_i2.p1  ORF type:complete len:619 (+),score=96.70 TRINITY_DN21698_c0_g1_i2:101-1858(+)
MVDLERAESSASDYERRAAARAESGSRKCSKLRCRCRLRKRMVVGLERATMSSSDSEEESNMFARVSTLGRDLKTVERILAGKRAQRVIRCRVGGVLLLLAMVSGLLFDVMNDLRDLFTNEHHCGTKSAFLWMMFREFLWDGRLMLLSLAPLADGVCLTRCVLWIDCAAFASSRVVAFTTEGLPESGFSLWLNLWFYVRGVSFVFGAVLAMCQTSIHKMQSMMWGTIAVYLSLNMVCSVVCGFQLALERQCLGPMLAEAIPNIVVLYVVRRPKLRQGLQVSLGRLAQAYGARAAAAGIAGMVGDCSAQQALAEAKRRFRCVPCDLLRRDDFEVRPMTLQSSYSTLGDSTATPASRRSVHSTSSATFGALDTESSPLVAPEVSEKEEDEEEEDDDDGKPRAQKTRLGHCDAFLSHSWHDCPDAKWDALQAWRADFVARNAREPMIWLDRCCIDQSNIESDLRGLPLFLSGCKEMLVLCGPTYLSRLWCVMELFTFVHMGGDVSQITLVRLLRRGREKRDTWAIQRSVDEFDSEQCDCSVREDKEKMLDVIEVAFGDTDGFNVTIRQLLSQLSCCSSDEESTASDYA